jgi:hypothetical protein
MNKKRSKRGSGRKIKKSKSMNCREFLRKKIRENMRKYKSGKLMSNGRRIGSRQQAIAISYNQAKKVRCRKFTKN